MPAIYNRSNYIVTRGDDDDDDSNDSTMDTLVIILAVIVALVLMLLASLLILRRLRNQRNNPHNSPPKYDDVLQQDKHNNHHHRLTIETRSGRTSIMYNKDGKPMLANPNSPPHSPDNVPQIHITFPEEEEEGGKRKSGRVVIVRIGDNAVVGLEPLEDDESLPAYEKEGSFHSIDMDDIGGLREKEREDYH